MLSAGCHSGYNIVDRDAIVGVTEKNDWTQRMAQQGALLVGGTGYQYGDTDFLEYSERLYLELARRLHEAPDTGPIAVGKALVQAKQDYLAGLTTVSGIDQKALLQATLYGLPMTGFDAPGRNPIGDEAGGVVPTGASTVPGSLLGLRVADKDYGTVSDPDSKTLDGAELTWLDGHDGVVVQPGAPALPKQIEDVSVDGAVLRGIGFRKGAYHDDSGIFPLTGAPAIEGSTPNSTFESDFFFPQSLTTANYFGTLGSSGRTSLILTPAQYRTDNPTDPDLPTNTVRAYSSMGVRLFYTGPDSEPALTAPPAIDEARGTVAGGTVTFTARVTGNPVGGRPAGVGHLDLRAERCRRRHVGAGRPRAGRQRLDTVDRHAPAERCLGHGHALPGAGRQRRRHGVAGHRRRRRLRRHRRERPAGHGLPHDARADHGDP